MVGKTVQQYQFLEKLGAGGMGEIFKAQDTRLNRFVAIKALTSASAGDPERRRRFIQEAQAASALNHPNIITIHDILSDGDSDFMVMEYVQGKTLVDLIPKGGLRVPQVLKLAIQMTDALAAAHTAGIIHRDLKPGNVMVTESGLAKILDFGLAKLSDRGPLSQSNPTDATQTIAQAPLTMEGSIIGTVSYMSPEQAQGRKVDTRSDIFSMGVLLYEMVTGTRAFPGDSALSTLSAILRDEARPIPEIVPDVPPQLEQVIARCLRKNPDDRFQTMKDVQMAMSSLKHESDSGVLYRAAAVAAAKGTHKKAPTSALTMSLVAGAVVVLLGGAGGVWWWTNRSAPAPPPEPVAAVQPAPPEPTPPPPVDDRTLTNDSIIQMVQAKVPTDVILGQIRSGPVNFNLSSGEVIRLSQAGISGSLIAAMRDPASIPAQLQKASPPVTPAGLPAQIAKNGPAPKGGPGGKDVAKGSAKEGEKGKEEFDNRLKEILTPPPPAPEPAPTPPPRVEAPPPPTAPTRQVTVADGSPFTILLAADIRNDAAAGSPLRFTVASDVRSEGAIVIAKGAVATGSIAQAARRRLIGSTKATLKLLTVQGVDGRPLKIRALSARSGKGDPERNVDTGAKTKSDDIAAAAGTEYIAYIDGEAKVSVR
jgi:hypothetical protein